MKVTMKEIKDLHNELLNNKCACEKKLVEEKGRNMLLNLEEVGPNSSYLE